MTPHGIGANVRTLARSPRERSVVAPSGEQFEFAHGEQRAVVVEVGGGLRAYSAGGRDVLDGYGVDEMCFAGRGQLLIPWPNRLQDGRYEFAGRDHQLALTEPERQCAIHGLVRWAAWTVTGHERDRVVMEYVLRPQPGYPFALALTVEYVLSDEGLRVRTTAVNAGVEPCPFGSGAHPYLTVGTPLVDDTILRAPARTVLLTDERGTPVHSYSVDGTEYDFYVPRRIGRTRLDHCFTELERDRDGLARVTLGRRDDAAAVTLWMDASYSYLMLFTGDSLPEGNRRSLAVEPMTCPPNAFRTGESLVTLEPDGCWSGEWGIDPRPLAPEAERRLQ
jgi:aldose 1-epimerase